MQAQTRGVRLPTSTTTRRPCRRARGLGVRVHRRRPRRRVLFDAGAKPDVLTHNAEALQVDLGHLDAVVLCMNGDKRDSRRWALARPVFYAGGSNPTVVAALGKSGAKLVAVSTSVDVAPGMRTSDEFGTSSRKRRWSSTRQTGWSSWSGVRTRAIVADAASESGHRQAGPFTPLSAASTCFRRRRPRSAASWRRSRSWASAASAPRTAPARKPSGCSKRPSATATSPGGVGTVVTVER